MKFIIRNDMKGLIKFTPLQSEAAMHILKEAGIDSARPDSVAYLSGNRIYYKSGAILKIFQDMGGIWKALLVFKMIPRAISDAVYDFIAKRRYKIFGKKESCMIPDKSIAGRFI